MYGAALSTAFRRTYERRGRRSQLEQSLCDCSRLGQIRPVGFDNLLNQFFDGMFVGIVQVIRLAVDPKSSVATTSAILRGTTSKTAMEVTFLDSSFEGSCFFYSGIELDYRLHFRRRWRVLRSNIGSKSSVATTSAILRGTTSKTAMEVTYMDSSFEGSCFF